MQAEIITIGDEILIGQVVDTNSAFIAKELNKIGVSVYQIVSVQDDRAHILKAMEEAGQHAQITIITGGLGPTKDDITKATFCEFFEDALVQDPKVLQNVEDLIRKFSGAPLNQLNQNQALVPSKATVLYNVHGTAPGMWMEKEGKVFISLPGVPFEMRHLMESAVLPRLQERFDRPFIVHRTLVTYGMGESALAEKIADWEDALPSHIKLAYLPNLGKVRLRLTAKGPDVGVLQQEVADQITALYGIIGDIIQGEEEEGLETVIGHLLTEKGMTLSTAESFTGGLIAGALTAVPGASAYFKGSLVSYATETKIKVLGVPEELVAAHSVVSGPVAESMAEHARILFGTDFAVASTGNAGPTKGDSDAAVGTVFLAVASPSGVFSVEYQMGSHRERIVKRSVNKALELLQKEILKF